MLFFATTDTDFPVQNPAGFQKHQVKKLGSQDGMIAVTGDVSGWNIRPEVWPLTVLQLKQLHTFCLYHIVNIYIYVMYIIYMYIKYIYIYLCIIYIYLLDLLWADYVTESWIGSTPNLNLHLPPASWVGGIDPSHILKKTWNLKVYNYLVTWHWYLQALLSSQAIGTKAMSLAQNLHCFFMLDGWIQIC